MADKVSLRRYCALLLQSNKKISTDVGEDSLVPRVLRYSKVIRGNCAKEVRKYSRVAELTVYVVYMLRNLYILCMRCIFFVG